MNWITAFRAWNSAVSASMAEGSDPACCSEREMEVVAHCVHGATCSDQRGIRRPRPSGFLPMAGVPGRSMRTQGGGLTSGRDVTTHFCVGGPRPGSAAHRGFLVGADGLRPPDQRENRETPRAFRLTMAAMPMNRPALPQSRLSIKPGSMAFLATPCTSA